MKFSLKIKACTLLMLISLLEGVSYSQTGQWYKGDLHAHSTYSDGEASVADVISDAEEKGLDFFVITDHDWLAGVVNHKPLAWSDPTYFSNSLVLLYGAEWTTDNGHACIWNSKPFDYNDIFVAKQSNNYKSASELAKRQNGIFSVNHPLNMELRWNYGFDFDLMCMEIINGPYSLAINYNFAVISNVWHKLLLSGRRITAVGGSDMHYLDHSFLNLYANIGIPVTYVYAKEKTAEAIIDGIRKGHVCVGLNLSSPVIEFSADTSESGTYDILSGDNIEKTNKKINFRIKLMNYGLVCRVKCIKNGLDLYTNTVEISPENPIYEFTDVPEGRTYYRLEISSEGETVCWTNPIYVGYNVYPLFSENYSDRFDFKIFPNPCQEKIFISNSECDKYNVKVYHVSGNFIKSFTSTKHLLEIDMKDFTSGIYIFTITSDKEIKTYSIFKY